MKGAFLLRVLSASSLLVNANTNSIDHQQREDSLDDFIKAQQQISLQGMLDNIVEAPYPDLHGMVVASRSDTDYWYTWIRTAALTFKVLVERLTPTDILFVPDQIIDYVESQGELQSGDLGEPKFYVNGTVFKGAWNRPQQDGPALRATALNIYAKYLLAYLEGTKLARVLRADVDFDVWPIIAKDLDHTVRYWNQTSFDLWEETSGSSFFTLSVSHRALVEGMALAKTLGRHCDGCYAAASQMLCSMESFWDVNHIRANLNARDQRSGIDASSILSSIHTALANHKTVTDSFRPLYGINSGIAQGQGVAIGRTLFVVGDVPELGDGKNEHARVLKQDLRGFLISGSYGYANYSAQIEVPALTRINYHYFMLAKDHPKEEEEYQYRHIDTGECGSNVDTVRNVFFPDG
ncbi:hypothetical protein J4E90_002986 [Alternaria incomplexa]|uniref:uncharacterized protein n=1 Tax=Alternaria incomplexa TaxID=1187928 RepID=UPI00221FC0B3|nr:uncharacterized protein J4E90_002986 [Alternaria incomplexa]KAI4918600.1 hypothetical protein J4E90_002986 [Alternaria incomplexa]